MGALVKYIVVLVALVLAYFLLWPVPVDPVDWEAPQTDGYRGAFAPNTKLQDTRRIDLGGHVTPEDITIGPDGWLYTGVHGGKILRIDPGTGTIEEFADTGGQTLGVEFDAKGNLIAADAYQGLLSIAPTGEVTRLADRAEDGSEFGFVDDLDITPDGAIWFSDASTKFPVAVWQNTLLASLMEIWEHAGTGRVMRYDPATEEVTTILTNMVFPNGIAADPEGNFILVNETGSYRVLKFWLTGPLQGTSQVLVDNLPGFPDNINRDVDGTYLLGLVSPRSADIDALAGSGFLRKILWRMPGFQNSAVPEPYSHLVRLDAEGTILETWQDPLGGYPDVTGGVRGANEEIYVSSLTTGEIAVIAP